MGCSAPTPPRPHLASVFSSRFSSENNEVISTHLWRCCNPKLCRDRKKDMLEVVVLRRHIGVGSTFELESARGCRKQGARQRSLQQQTDRSRLQKAMTSSGERASA